MVNNRCLTLDTTLPSSVLELWTGSVRTHWEEFPPARHAQGLIPALKRVLEVTGISWGDINLFIVNTGPGSFTGVRVALAAIKGIAFVGGQPVIGIDQFDAFAAGTAEPWDRLDVVVDGQLNTVSVVRFERLTGRTTPRTVHRDKLTDLLDSDVPWVSPSERLPAVSGYRRLRASAALFEAARPRMSEGRYDDLFALEPNYVRPSSAEEKWDARPVSG
ncbi:MAG: tRNA (adenosine(37)-N6)-threonylcarbamoyltransferase complex dimerization subunit type 1 TsaB [Gemmataceae bacterium]|nr:tRNA (adenosine(37)-N6)-threonylcarbamoyltransferase complex dimerization subunit type 1 TsaB [Gemmataceae bacterium]